MLHFEYFAYYLQIILFQQVVLPASVTETSLQLISICSNRASCKHNFGLQDKDIFLLEDTQL